MTVYEHIQSLKKTAKAMLGIDILEIDYRVGKGYSFEVVAVVIGKDSAESLAELMFKSKFSKITLEPNGHTTYKLTAILEDLNN